MSASTPSSPATDALAVLRARLARHKAAGRVLQAKECEACVVALMKAARLSNGTSGSRTKPGPHGTLEIGQIGR